MSSGLKVQLKSDNWQTTTATFDKGAFYDIVYYVISSSIGYYKLFIILDQIKYWVTEL